MDNGFIFKKMNENYNINTKNRAGLAVLNSW